MKEWQNEKAEEGMKTIITVGVGPATASNLRRVHVEGTNPDTVVDQAVAVWSQLRGDDERRLAGLAVMAIVVDRLRDHSRGAAS